MSRFATCRPDYKNGLIWCQHSNGSWAPPFTMSDRQKEEEGKKEETTTNFEERDGFDF